MFEDLVKLSKNGNKEGIFFKTGHRFFNSKVCDYSKKHVYCCTGDQYPSKEQVEELKAMEPCLEPTGKVF